MNVPPSSDPVRHSLDHPIWSALTSEQSAIAEGNALALKYPSAIAPFAAVADGSAASFAALEALMGPAERVVFFTPERVEAPASLETIMARSADQMIGICTGETTNAASIVTLGAEDVPQMMKLVEVARPGPFNLRTHELGTFIGIRSNGELVAMTGERMKLGGYTEITAVCTHPDHRGRGYAQALLVEISKRIVAKGKMPFLHVFSDNEQAIAVYRRVGLELRRRLHVTVLAIRV